MNLDLQFRPMKAPPTPKALLTFRKDAGLKGAVPQKAAHDARGVVQWVSVELKNKQVGIARLEIAPPMFCFVSDLMVLSQYRGRGIGHWLIQRIEQYCLGRGTQRLLLEAAEGTDSFYKSQAFVPDPLAPRLWRKEISPLHRKIFTPMFG
ncbi:GNAT family N-acetyltransferase [Pseudoduganella sp. FT25W]|uniref:GNAT family N-acetyltransferase n=1 Tax=Duganella alba TaxID=2666081 RepID=A0A6L5QL25_9BURK|nr:GNAT family N-acetyltransferase [Duganella alba]MRX10513.1 GNAT family N-acetyltransferase [Duganella alba]MRX18133.1 GNAT family N-acetyltransferase [Duganella alba]